jgi:hypothetical protein
MRLFLGLKGHQIHISKLSMMNMKVKYVSIFTIVLALVYLDLFYTLLCKSRRSTKQYCNRREVKGCIPLNVRPFWHASR